MVKNETFKAMVLLFAVGMIGGCATSATTGAQFDQSKAEDLQVGVSSKQDVMSALGSPYRQTTNLDGSEAWVYEFTSLENRPTAAAALGFYAMMAGADTIKSTYNSQKLMLELRDGLLTHCVLSVVEGDEQGGVVGEGMQKSAASGKRSSSVCAGSDPETVPQWMQVGSGI